MRQVTLWDSKVFYLVFGKLDRKIWKRIFYVLSRSADAVSCAVAGLILWMGLPGSGPYVAAGLLAFGLELSLYYLLKKGIRRPRPFKSLAGVQFLIVPPDEFSFPSGHTAAAFLVATLLTAACPWLALPALAWASLVGFSRVYLGVHYPTDVLAGMVLGSLCAQAGLFFFHLG
ncbi:MAG TPA: phosphatase PAP2 family protein [bacterium]|nr:phosphatase PAP2 family protein [bacterium]